MQKKILVDLRGRAEKSIADFKISTKIMLFYSVLLVVSIIFSTVIYQRIYSNIISSKVSELSIQTLSSINLNLDQIMESVNNYSKAILSNDDVQDLSSNLSPASSTVPEVMQVAWTGAFAHVDVLSRQHVNSKPRIRRPLGG